MCLSFNWLLIGSYTNLLCMESDPYSVPYHPSNLVFHVVLNDCYPWVHFSQKLFIFSFSAFTNVSMTLPKSIPITFFPSMTKQLSFYHPAIVCCTLCLFIGSAPMPYALANLIPHYGMLVEYRIGRVGSVENNSRIEYWNFRKVFFSKKKLTLREKKYWEMF